MITHHYSLQFVKEGEGPVGDPVGLSLGGVLSGGIEALRWRSFQEDRRGLEDPVQVLPRWSEELGEPVVSKLQLEAGPASVLLPVERLFRGAALWALVPLIEDGTLTKEDRPAFLVTALPAEEAKPLPAFQLDDYPVADDPIDVSGTVVDEEFAAPGDLPVVMAPQVLEDAVRQAEAAGEDETGGILFGQLTTCVNDVGPALSITHLCPATGGRGDGTSFTFTPECWTTAQDTLAARNRSEIMVGSFHSHPDFCRDCPPQRQKDCRMRTAFFSGDDEQLQQSVFPAAYSVGVLLSHDGERFIPSLWGWRDGFISRRSYNTSI